MQPAPCPHCQSAGVILQLQCRLALHRGGAKLQSQVAWCLHGTAAAAGTAQGAIEVERLVVRYRPELDPVLKGISFSVRGREKVRGGRGLESGGDGARGAPAVQQHSRLAPLRGACCDPFPVWLPVHAL